MERKGLRLPDRGLVEHLDLIRRNVVGNRLAVVAGLDLDCAVFRPDPGGPSLGACYDEDGTVYVPK
ncbi:MAG: hypothetical protein ACRDJE_21045, partial [Dehalococcoidia bacterium]